MKKLFLLINVFTFGYCFGYYFFKILRKTKKKKLSDFLKITKKNMACSNQDLVKKMKDIQLCEKVKLEAEDFFETVEKMKDIQLYKVEVDLKAEKDFLELTTEAVAKDLQKCVISYFVNKKSMAICC